MTGDTFRDARRHLGWTKRECSNRFGVHERTIWRWEKKTAPPRWAVIKMQELTA